MENQHSAAQMMNSQTKSGWICIIVAWFFMLLPIPVVSWLGASVMGFVSAVVAIVVIAKGHTRAGILQMLVLLFGSPIVYMIGLAIMGETFANMP